MERDKMWDNNTLYLFYLYSVTKPLFSNYEGMCGILGRILY